MARSAIPVRCLLTALLFLTFFAPAEAVSQAPPLTARASALIARVRPDVHKELREKGFLPGAPIFLRIFKMPGTLEVWMEKDGRFQLFKEYPVCRYSGFPGPKLQEGDWQSPEGFYTVTSRQMNPNSSYHLSFNIGYPNAFDRARQRTGSSIMVHGGCSSRGCFAMGDRNIEEIYLLAHEALANGQERFNVHIFPFALTARNLFKFRSSPWIGFWKKLRPGYEAFEQNRMVPDIVVENGNYVVKDQAMRVALMQRSEHKTR